MRARAVPILVAVGLILATVPVAAGGTVDLVDEPVRRVVHVPRPADAGVQNHTKKDAECFAEVPLLDSNSCTDSWDQGAGNFSADWHSTFHDLWTIGRVSLTVRDAVDRVVFQRDCRWLAVTGLCIVQIEDGVAGEWTMRLDARVEATVGASSTAHGWFHLVPAD